MKKNNLSKIAKYPLFLLPIIWLLISIGLFLTTSVSIQDWQSFFPLRNYPVWSIILLIIIVIAFQTFTVNNSSKDKNWLSFIKNTNRETKTALLFSVVFYIGLIVAVSIFPHLTGYTFGSDWVLLIVAAIPILALLIMLIITQVTSVKAKFAGVEIEFHRTITTPLSQSVKLEEAHVSKGLVSDLSRIVQKIREDNQKPHILIVQMNKQCPSPNIDFVALRDYVYQLSRVSFIEFIVFIDERDKYLGYMSVDKFKAKYPIFGIELLLQDIDLRNSDFRFWRRLFDFPFMDPDALEKVQYELVLSQWDPQRERRGISARDLPQLGADTLYLREPTVIHAYRVMVENKVSGIPVIDRRGLFIGVATKEKILQETMIQLLERDTN